MQSADQGFTPACRTGGSLKTDSSPGSLHRRPDCDEECESTAVLDADSSVLLGLRATIGKSANFFSVRSLGAIGMESRESLLESYGARPHPSHRPQPSSRHRQRGASPSS